MRADLSLPFVDSFAATTHSASATTAAAVHSTGHRRLPSRRRVQRMAQAPDSPPWLDLPPELLGLVFLGLPTRADRASFPAVCRTWCSAARQCRLPPPSPVPWLVLPGRRVVSFPHGETFRLPVGVRHHNSCGEWLLLSRDDDSCFLLNPFTKATIPLPSLSSYSYYEQPVEFGDGVDPNIDIPGKWMHIMEGEEVSVLSLVVCSTRLIAALVAIDAAAAIALCRPGAAAWSVSAHDDCRWLTHLVFFHGKLYALDTNNYGLKDLIAIDIVDEHDADEPMVSRIERVIEGAYLPRHGMHYLLESHGSLLMIFRKHSYKRTHGFSVAGCSELKVFKADFEQHLWAEVWTLGNDQALFLGRGCSRAVHVSPYDLSGDCIFFLDDDHCWLRKEKTPISCGLYDMKDGKVCLPLPAVSWKSGKVPAAWIFSQGETGEL